ncbi:hypothetical protein FDP41_011928 [Naegleria fowleri]|uniref:Uncharacterized protein n=1 Tax=Naegleria fowleri TaxID=5763 RepID=A0A6A5BXS1_NAEFO|nr:uncharacterized protein FDP41_011928 [Naegleria fowleri]KAF0982067.1 hypothetical protein FDP41_011928 [Naegleria fowleri]
MLLSGVYPTTEHYNTYLDELANTNDNFYLHDTFDDLKRRNPYQKPDAASFNTMLDNYIRHQDGQRALIQLEYMKSKNIAVDASLEGKLKELVVSKNIVTVQVHLDSNLFGKDFIELILLFNFIYLIHHVFMIFMDLSSYYNFHGFIKQLIV